MAATSKKQSIVSKFWDYTMNRLNRTVFLGLKAGGNFYKSDALGLKPYSDTPDPTQISISSFNPNIGIGAYAKRDNHWFSFSIPRLFNNKRS